MRTIRRYRIFLSIIFLFSAVACGEMSSPGGNGQNTSAVTLREDIAAYVKRCEQMNKDFAPANFRYNRTQDMQFGESKPIDAVLTLGTPPPPDEVFHASGTDPTVKDLLVSCSIDAQLRGDESEFSINPQGWHEQSLLATDTLHWVWFVTPKQGGQRTLVLELRPVVTVKASELPAGTEPGTQPYEITAHVHVPPDKWIVDMSNRTTVLFKSLAALAIAAIALLTTLGIRRSVKKRRAGSPAHNTTP